MSSPEPSAAPIDVGEEKSVEVRRGVGTELVRRLLAELESFYMVDVICDPDVAPFYERLGMVPLTGLARRDHSALP